MTELGLTKGWYKYDFYNGRGTLIWIMDLTPRTVRFQEWKYLTTVEEISLEIEYCDYKITEFVSERTTKVYRKDGNFCQIEVDGDYDYKKLITLDQEHKLENTNIYNPFKKIKIIAT